MTTRKTSAGPSTSSLPAVSPETLMNHEPSDRLARSGWWHLPMVWSHCLAGGWLDGSWPGAERWDRLTILLLGASALSAAGALLGGARPTQPALPVLLYPLATALSVQPTLTAAVGEGTLLALYLGGSALVARGGWMRWAWLLVVLPVVVNAALAARFGPRNLIMVVLAAFWLGRVAFGRTAPLGLSRETALMVGSVLVDLSAVAACTALLPWPGWFAILFALALVCVRLRLST